MTLHVSSHGVVEGSWGNTEISCLLVFSLLYYLSLFEEIVGIIDSHHVLCTSTCISLLDDIERKACSSQRSASD